MSTASKRTEQPRWAGLAAVRRRQQAALRLPPLACGCRDPQSLTHREGRCRRRRGGTA